ncbi:MAG: riboflavin biosynthesis protein RibF [Synergistaceae bacterium]|nr:riboflavin biosynthesis protein RibF [Synergistota bacterium]NLM72273.1 riboflavin biosynthesis protein RibF [Synergistaceae bacterium]
MIVVLGAFDGFHRGHALLLDRARALAAERNPDNWGVVTFTPHPDRVILGDTVKYLFTESERDTLARFFDIPNVARIPFDRELAGMSPADFIAVLESLLPVSGIVVGEDYHFGRGRKGDADFLRARASSKGWAFEMVRTLETDAMKISSSRVKTLIVEGDVIEARNLLGYPFFFTADVVKGDGRGRTLGFPTANVQYPEDKVVPSEGVYAASVFLGEKWLPGALNIGFNPTFLSGLESPRFETYVLDTDRTFYGETISVFIEERIRPEIRFGSKTELKRRMKADADAAREIFDRARERDADVYGRLADALSGFQAPRT